MEAQIGRSPGFNRMAILALQSEAPHMNFWFGMAVDALTGSPRENLPLMTGCAIDRGMHPFQRKNLGMVKITEPVNPIMAVQAPCPKLLQVTRHEISPRAGGWIIPRGVTIDTSLNFKAGFKISGMTILANHRITLVILDMPVQAKARLLIMFERFAIQEGR
jgi:hypothetical protein